MADYPFSEDEVELLLSHDGPVPGRGRYLVRATHTQSGKYADARGSSLRRAKGNALQGLADVLSQGSG